MKKLFLVLSLVGICSLGYAQDVKVNINNQDGTAIDNCPYRINGICATEDIGGVDIEFQDAELVLTNYNPFAVNVLWQIEYTGNSGHCHESIKTGTVVIGAEGQKRIQLGYSCYYKDWSVRGLIVRKLAQ